MANSKLKCKGCGDYYRVKPEHPSFRRWCSDDCAVAIVTKARTKQRERAKKQQEWQVKEDKRIDVKVRKMKKDMRSNDIKLRKKTAQTAFNAYIRKRDEKLPCVSCQRFHKGQYHAGHFKTTASRPDLRFNEDNCHKQCSACNNYLSGNIGLYRPNLLVKIGLSRFNALKLEKLVNHTCADLKEIELKYKQKLKALI